MLTLGAVSPLQSQNLLPRKLANLGGMSSSKAKFTPLPSSEVDGMFKATMPSALQESIFRTAAHYAAYPSPLLLIIGMILRVSLGLELNQL